MWNRFVPVWARLKPSQPDRLKEGEKDFNSSLGPISLAGTRFHVLIFKNGSVVLFKEDLKNSYRK